MKNKMEYRGYYGSISYSEEDNLLFGKVENIRNLISFEGNDVNSMRKSFEEAIDDYLALCEQKKVEPETPFSGVFNVRIGSELHRKIAQKAEEAGVNLNKFVKQALETNLQTNS